MSLSITASEASLGATIGGLRLAELDAQTFESIHEAFLEYAVLVFPDQHLTLAQQATFGRRFGEFDPLVQATGSVAISNLRSDGRLRPRDDAMMGILLGNEGWHTDSSYMPVSAKASILSAEIVPTAGGETEWADMRDALETLDAARRAQIGGRAARHSLQYSQARSGHEKPGSYSYGYEDHDAPLRPLIKTHPETGRDALFIGRHAYDVTGLSTAESEALLDDLLSFACQSPRLWSHRWAVGDVALWDNRCVLHRARPYDLDEPRVMHHTRIAGDPVTERGLDTRN